MKKLILILALLLPFIVKGQDYRVIDWKTDVLNVQAINTDTFKFETEIKDYNDPGAITREIGNYFIDFVARCFKIIDSDANTITVVDLEHINLAPQSNKIGRVYQSIVDADSIFKSIGGVDISVLDDLSRWKDVARNNELFGRKIKDLADSTAAIRALANTKATISGTDNFIMKKTGANTLGNSSITDNGSLVSSTLPIRSLGGFSSIGANQVILYGQNTSGSLDEKYWFPISFNGNTMTSYIANDAANVATVISQTKRVGNTIESICYPNGIFGFGNSAPLYYMDALFNKPTDDGFKLKNTDSIGSTNVMVYNNNNKLAEIGIYGTKHRSVGVFDAGCSYFYTNTNAFSIGSSGSIKFATGGITQTMKLDSIGRLGVGADPLTKIHSQSTTTQLRLGYDATKYTDLSVGSTGNLTIAPTGGHTTFSDIAGDSLVVSNLKIPTGAGLNKVWTSDANGNGYWGAVLGVPKVGDYYGGGQVYYVSPSGTYGYCVYPSVIATNTYWSPTNNNAVIASNQAVGAGIANTTAIVAVFGAGNYAAYKVDTLNIGGYSDWALPSIGDADLIHDSLYSAFPTSNPMFYLCSNDASTTGYMYQWATGQSYGVNKGTSVIQPELYGVIAVRRFVISTQSFNLSVSESDGSPAYSAINAIQFANCVLSQPTSNTVLVTPNAGTTGITNLGIQVPTGLTVNPTSLTANGTFTFGLQSGYSIPTTAKQSQWDAGYTYRLTSASGTSPLTLSLSNNALTGSLNSTLTNIGNVNPSTGYLYWNGSSYSYQAATTTYTLPTASNSTLGGIQVSSTDGGLAMSGNYLLQKDNALTTRTPEVSDYIAFYDNSATAQGKMTLSTLGSLIGTSGGMVYPGAGIPVSTGSTWSTSKTAPSGAIVGTTDSQALTNKSVNGVTLSTGEGNNKILFGDGTYKIINGVQTLTSASSITMNFATAPKASLSLATNGTISITNVPNGGEGSIEVTSSGAYTLAIAGSTGYTTTQKMGTVAAIASSAHTTVFYWRSGTVLYYGFLLNN